MAKVKINSEACIGCGLCAATCPESFAINGEGKAEVIADVDDGMVDTVVESCPVAAIEKE